MVTVRDIRDRYWGVVLACCGVKHSLGSDVCAVCQIPKGHDSIGSDTIVSWELRALVGWLAGWPYVWFTRHSRSMANANNMQEFIHLLWRNHSLKSQIYHRECDCLDGELEKEMCGVSQTATNARKRFEKEGNLMNSSLCVIRGLTKQPMTSKQW